LSASRSRPLDVTTLRSEPLPLDPADEKTDRGTVLVIGGSPETVGAVILAGLSVLRVGAGRLQIMVAGADATALGPAIPEALIGSIDLTDGSGDGNTQLLERIEQAQAILLGPGMADPGSAKSLLGEVARHSSPTSVVVLDAIAIGGVPDLEPELRSRLAGRWVITPNGSELQALMPGERSDDLTVEAARRFRAIVSSSGVVANLDGNAWAWQEPVVGLGTSGSGDVLAGLIAGAAARCGNAAQAARWGTYLHMASGLRSAQEVGPIGYLARELLEPIPNLMLEAGEPEPST
jgi:ADP-dependent NAD(P)H-hydrate dehydratase